MAESHPANTGRSDSTDLPIVKLAPNSDETPYENAFGRPLPSDKGILRLPDEVLLQIFTKATTCSCPDFKQRANDYPISVSLSITCRRFNRIVASILYKNIHLCTSHHKDDLLMLRRATSCLHRTMTENPSLRSKCRSLGIHICDGPNDAIISSYFMDLLVWLKSTKGISVCGSLEAGNDGLHFKTAVQNMPMLEEVYFSRSFDLIQIHGILVDLSHLRVLDLSRVRILNDRLPCDTFKKGTSPITSLAIKGFEDSSDILHRLVAWPAKLEHFSFAECGGEDSRPWSLSTIASVISPHKTTLRSLTIGEVQERGLVNFDLTAFESLEHLSLSAWATGFNAGYETNLLAPRLTKFRWSFTTPREDIIDFDDEQEIWLRRFAAAAVARKLTLQEIFIQFNLRSFCGQCVSFNEIYPWDRMKHIARDIQGHGINLSWADPNMSREFWQGFCGPITDEEWSSNI